MAANRIKIKSLLHLYEIIPEDQQIIVDVLRQIVADNLPDHCVEKISYNVPFFKGKKGICIIWPAAIPRGGIKEGVLLGFWYGHMLTDEKGYLDRGTNKQIYYKIYKSVDEIDQSAIVSLLAEAIEVDSNW